MAFCNYVARSIYSTFSSRHRLLVILPLPFFSSCRSSLYFIGLTRPIESHSEVWGNILAGALWEENFFLKMVHFCVLYISERRQGSKRRGTRGI